LKALTITSGQGGLLKWLEEARSDLIANGVKTHGEAKGQLDRVEGIREYLRRQRESHEVQQAAAETSLLLKWHIGTFLAGMVKSKGTLKQGSRLQPVTTGAPTLRDLKIEKWESKRYQDVAKIRYASTRRRERSPGRTTPTSGLAKDDAGRRGTGVRPPGAISAMGLLTQASASPSPGCESPVAS
jgi:hypothetical protein